MLPFPAQVAEGKSPKIRRRFERGPDDATFMPRVSDRCDAGRDGAEGRSRRLTDFGGRLAYTPAMTVDGVTASPRNLKTPSVTRQGSFSLFPYSGRHRRGTPETASDAAMLSHRVDFPSAARGISNEGTQELRSRRSN